MPIKVAAGPHERLAGLEDDPIFAMCPFLQFTDEVNANQGGAVDPQELFCIKSLFYTFDGSAHRIGMTSQVQLKVVTIRFGPVDLMQSDQYSSAVLLHQQSRVA